MEARTSERPARPARVEVVAYCPTAFFHCQHCEITFQHMGLGPGLRRDEARTSLPDDLLDDFHLLLQEVDRLKERHGDHIEIRLIDAASLAGFWLSLRHRLRRYPAVLIDGDRVDLSEPLRLTAEIDRYLSVQTGASREGGGNPG